MPVEPLPPPRETDRPYRVALVCLGNICRSPIADVVLGAALARAGLADRVEVQSSGTGDWHLGHPMDPRAAAALRGAGYDGSAHRARRFTARWFAEHDLILVMDRSNLRDVCKLAPDEKTAQQRVRMFRDFDPRSGPNAEVPDPYYGGSDGFAEVLGIVERSAACLVEQLAGIFVAERRA